MVLKELKCQPASFWKAALEALSYENMRLLVCVCVCVNALVKMSQAVLDERNDRATATVAATCVHFPEATRKDKLPISLNLATA